MRHPSVNITYESMNGYSITLRVHSDDFTSVYTCSDEISIGRVMSQAIEAHYKQFAQHQIAHFKKGS